MKGRDYCSCRKFFFTQKGFKTTEEHFFKAMLLAKMHSCRNIEFSVQNQPILL